MLQIAPDLVDDHEELDHSPNGITRRGVKGKNVLRRVPAISPHVNYRLRQKIRDPLLVFFQYCERVLTRDLRSKKGLDLFSLRSALRGIEEVVENAPHVYQNIEQIIYLLTTFKPFPDLH